MVTASRVYIFEPLHEKIYLLCLALIFIAISVIASGVVSPPSWENIWVRSVVSLVFFNSLHTALTFIGIALVPELRAWLREQLRPKRVLVFGVIVAAVMMTSYFVASTHNGVRYLVPFSTFIFVLLSSLHNVSQTKGIALLYNREIRKILDEDEKRVQSHVEKVERLLFNTLVVALVVGTLYVAFLRRKSDLNLKYALSAFALAAALGLVVNCMRYPKVGRSFKVPFTATAILHALILAAPFVLVFQRALHGLEYVFLAQKMSKRTRAQWTIGIVSFVFTLFGIFLVIRILVGPGRYGKTYFGLSDDVMIVLLTLAYWVEYLHYYIDSIMFRMKDSSVRTHVQPLLG